MYRSYESTPETEIHTHIIDYSRLVDSVQLSTARLLDIPGSLEADSFAQILEAQSLQGREHLIWEVGGHFDEELVNFVIASLIGRRNQQVIILAEATEGINGSLLWQDKLEQRKQTLNEQGYLKTVELKVVRYSNEVDELPTKQAQALAA